VAGRIRGAWSGWRRKRYLKKHPEPHRNKDVPRKRGWADPGERQPNVPPPTLGAG
jgi:hypothetical protein